MLLAVPVDAGDAENFRGTEVEGNVAETGSNRGRRLREIPDGKDRGGRFDTGVNLVDHLFGIAAALSEHQFDEFRNQGLFVERMKPVRRDFSDLAPQLQDRDPVAECRGFPELVRDENDGETAADQLPHQHAKLLDSGGRQHRGRLVEDQYPAIAQQRPQDLDMLLLAEREFGRPGIEVDLDAQRP